MPKTPEQSAASVETWFDGWAGFHMEVNPRDDWESLRAAPAFWSNWRTQFIRHGLHDVQVAIQASERVSLLELKKKGDHLRFLLEAATDVYRETRESFNAHSGVPRTRKEAEADARGCLDCNGEGIAGRFVHAELLGRFATPGGRPFPLGSLVTFYCPCAVGRWMKAATRSEPAPRGKRAPWEEPRPVRDDDVARLGDLADHPDLLRAMVPWNDEQPDTRYRFRPEHWDAYTDSPMPVPATTLEGLREMIDRDLAERRAKLREATRDREEGRFTAPTYGKPKPIFSAPAE